MCVCVCSCSCVLFCVILCLFVRIYCAFVYVFNFFLYFPPPPSLPPPLSLSLPFSPLRSPPLVLLLWWLNGVFWASPLPSSFRGICIIQVFFCVFILEEFFFTFYSCLESNGNWGWSETWALFDLLCCIVLHWNVTVYSCYLQVPVFSPQGLYLSIIVRNVLPVT